MVPANEPGLCYAYSQPQRRTALSALSLILKLMLKDWVVCDRLPIFTARFGTKTKIELKRPGLSEGRV